METGTFFTSEIGYPLGILLHAPRAAEDRTGFVRQTHMFGTQTADSQRAWSTCRGGVCSVVVLPGISLTELKGNSPGELMYRGVAELWATLLTSLMSRGVVELCETLLKS